MSQYSLIERQKMKRYIIEDLIQNYSYEKKKAREIVDESVFNQLLTEEPDYVFHYSISYWTEEINNDYIEQCNM